MKNAVKDVISNHMGLREAVERNDVKFQTLARYVNKQKKSPNESISMKPKYDTRRIFTDEQESSLVNYVLQCSKMCYGKSTKDVRILAYELAIANNVNVPKSWKDNKKAGVDWLNAFIKRHSNISIRQPEGCSLSRATSFNHHNVNTFFDNLERVMQRCDSFSDGSRVYNIDETATTTVQRSNKILAQKGVKQISKCTSGERGSLVTTCCIINALGKTVPPVMVFPRTHFKTHMIHGAPAGTLGLANPSGWMTSELFVDVIQHFIKRTSSSVDRPTLLIMDNHETHLSIDCINLAKEHGITLLTLPPHCSNRLQPLDVSVYASFKAFYNAAIDSWMLRHPGVPFTIYQVAECVGVAFEKSMTPVNIKSGFKKHMPERTTSRRCAHCSTKTDVHRSKWSCTTCKVALCLTETRNCFKEFHAK
ncbi:tigger transposable element-derived protein 6-like [Zophobas morio]|uniref:tigger transposable element-derived protein 6-like n=1 Tax=Zophobas morio TaxID=2755281 RepID=UPI003083B7CB